MNTPYARYDDSRPGQFTRTSSLADLAYVAALGLTSRVSRRNSIVSLDNLSDAFSDVPEFENPVIVQGGWSWPLVRTSVLILLSALSAGFNSGKMSTPAEAIRSATGIPAAKFAIDASRTDNPVADWTWTFVVSIYCLAAMLSCTTAAQLADRWGRRTFLLWTSVIFVVGGLLEAGASCPLCLGGVWGSCNSRVVLLVAGRAVSGIACGGAAVIVPLYLGEVAPPHLRGALGSAFQLSLALGAAFGQLGGLVVTADSWPWFLALGILPATAQLLLQPMLLESPRWCAMSGEDRMAEAMLVQLRGRSSPTEELQEELYCMLQPFDGSSGSRRPLSRSSSANSNASAGGDPYGHRGPADDALLAPSPPPASPRAALRAAASLPAVRRAVGLCVALAAAQQLCGINSLLYYGYTYLKQNGLSDDGANAAVLCMNFGAVASTVASGALMDKVGRRPLLLLSMLACAAAALLLTLALAATAAAHDAGAAPAALPTAAVACAAAAFVFSYGVGLGPVPALLPAELFPPEQRAAGFALVGSATWLANCAASLTFLLQASLLGADGFVPHAAVLLAALVYALFNMVETRGKSLERINRELSFND